MQIKTIRRNHLTPVRMASIKKTRENKCWCSYGERGALCTVGGDCKLVQFIVWRILKRLKIDYHMIRQFHFWKYIQKETTVLIPKDLCFPVSTAAMTYNTKTWKQPTCPSVNEWIKKMELSQVDVPR
uniref:Uncharacterized protein n=1 Tax=Felis catus TaxID=9685 RepID=A0ABI7Y2S0_FELCA